LWIRLCHRFGPTSIGAAVGFVAFGAVLTVAPPGWSAAATDPNSYQCTPDVVYARPGGVALRANVYQPREKGLLPAVLCVHGGAWVIGDRYQMAQIGERLAARGYVAVTIDYRHAPQFKFPAQIEDCRAALAWMRANAATYRIDPARISAWGYSAGAQLATLLALEEASQPAAAPAASSSRAEPLRAVVAGGTPCDFRQVPLDSYTLAYWLGGSRREKPEVYESASPARLVSPRSPPMFFYHGDADQLVPLPPVTAMMKQLEAEHVPTTLYVVRGCGHISAFFAPSALDQAIAFLDKYGKGPRTKGPRG
jgi:acetyl esterase/lipase